MSQKNIVVLVRDSNDDNPILDSKTSFQIVYEKASSLGFPLYVFGTFKNNDTIGFDGSVNSLLKQIDFNVKSFSNIIVFNSNMPLYDIELTKKMLKEHEENLADFTFAENYPPGFAPFIMNRSTFKKLLLISTGNNSPYDHKVLKNLIDLDINSYDIEIISPSSDMRFIREVFSVKNKRGFLLCKYFLENRIESNNIIEKIKNNPEILRPLPTYITIEISSKCNQSCVFCPYNLIKKDKIIPFDMYNLVKKIGDWIEDGYIEFSGIGEPFTYPYFEEIVRSIKDNQNINFIIETNGTLVGSWIEKIKGLNNLTIIVSINGSNKDEYFKIHSTDDFNLVESNIEKMIKNNINVYLQFVRSTYTEDFLESFIKRWEFIKEKIIIKKYNHFSCFLEDKKIVDLSPINRFPCWKLQRNIFIDSEGYIKPCYQDINKSMAFYLKEMDIQEVWLRFNSIYKKQWDNLFEGVCKDCDEWYIFDF